MSLDVWQGAEQEFASGLRPISLFNALEKQSVYIHRAKDNIPRAHLKNGGVCYVHSNLFEVCTPECRNAFELVAYDKASEAYARLASWAHLEQTGEQIHIYKVNLASDPKGEAKHTTVGAHENYLIERRGYSGKDHLLVPYLVLRQLFCGIGGFVDGLYMISPRTIFPRNIYSEISTDYPIISLRDEAHASEKFFRVHIVYGEGARSEYVTFLKHSITSYILQAIQKGQIKKVPELSDPIAAGPEISKCLDGDWSVKLTSGKKVRAIDYLNSNYLEGIDKVFADGAPSDHDLFALKEFKWVLSKLDEGLFEALVSSIEWVTKLVFIEESFTDHFSIEEGLDEASAKRAAANQYTAVTDPFFNELSESLSLRRIISDKEIESAFLEPPSGSRGYLRVVLAEHFRDSIDTMSWSYIKLKKRRSTLNFPFEILDGWTQEAVPKFIAEIESQVGSDT
jgi:proteasome accessory factor A